LKKSDLIAKSLVSVFINKRKELKYGK